MLYDASSFARYLDYVTILGECACSVGILLQLSGCYCVQLSILVNNR